MTDRELMQQALDALELVTDLTSHDNELYEAIDALRARLAQPSCQQQDDSSLVARTEPEPYGYIARRNWKMPVFIEADNVEATGLPYNNPDYEPVFKAPPQRNEPEPEPNDPWNCGNPDCDVCV